MTTPTNAAVTATTVDPAGERRPQPVRRIGARVFALAGLALGGTALVSPTSVPTVSSAPIASA